MKFIKSVRKYEFLLFQFELLLSIFWSFLPLLATKKNDASIYKILAVEINLDRLLKNCIKLNKYWISSSSNTEFGGNIDLPIINYLQKANLEP